MEFFRITQSKNVAFPVGRYVLGYFGWRTHTITEGILGDDFLDLRPVLLPDIGDMSPSLWLGVIGMPG